MTLSGKLSGGSTLQGSLTGEQGVSGSLSIAIQDTSGTVTANDVREDKTCWVNGEQVTGNLPRRTWWDITFDGYRIELARGIYENVWGYQKGANFDISAIVGEVENHSVVITPSVESILGGGYTPEGESFDGSPVTISAADLVSGNKAITANATDIDVTNYETCSVAVPYLWRGEECEFVQNLGTQSVKLADTSFHGWTPSTTAKTCKSAVNLTTFVADMTQYEYLVKWDTVIDVVYSTETTNTAPVRQVACIYQYIIKRPANLAAVASGARTTNSVVNYTVPLTKYYNSNSSLAMAWTNSYGLYPSATTPGYSNSTSDTPTITVKTPSWSARCSTTYMSTTAAGNIDESKTYFTAKATLYRCKIGAFARSSSEDCISVFNNGI